MNGNSGPDRSLNAVYHVVSQADFIQVVKTVVHTHMRSDKAASGRCRTFQASRKHVVHSRRSKQIFVYDITDKINESTDRPGLQQPRLLKTAEDQTFHQPRASPEPGSTREMPPKYISTSSFPANDIDLSACHCIAIAKILFEGLIVAEAVPLVEALRLAEYFFTKSVNRSRARSGTDGVPVIGLKGGQTSLRMEHYGMRDKNDLLRQRRE
ncbi:hypothetical protein B0H11DRAFT_1942615 [Mycena galericulata]|nr:hypothetical protein B0H11DRAFT_1942615 [Mycena galericulata]